MAKKAKKARPLNARQLAFVRHYTAGAEGVRANAKQAYIAAGYSAHTAESMGPRLLRNAQVAAAVAEAHQRAEKAAIRKLIDWKELAAEAQARLLAIARGRLPDPDDPDTGDALESRTDAEIAKVVQGAIEEILERAYPRKLQLDVSDPKGVLARLLGIEPDQIPDGDDE